jgi:hypothetical protein
MSARNLGLHGVAVRQVERGVLCGHTKSTIRYLGVDVEDVPLLPKGRICTRCAGSPTLG